MDLLKLWQGINQQAGLLADSVAGLPDACECGDADAHLEGRCSCCERHEWSAQGPKSAESCTAIIARLRVDLRMLCADFAAIAPAVDATGLTERRLELRRGVFLSAADLEQLTEAFERVTGAVAGFRRDCAITEMKKVKRFSSDLRAHCERVNAQLLGQGEVES